MNQAHRSHVSHVYVLSLRALPHRIVWLVGWGAVLIWIFNLLSQDFLGRTQAALEKTIEGLQDAARLIPHDPDIQHELGLIYLLDPLQFDAEQARIHLQQAIDQSPFNFNLWIDLGRAHEQHGQLEEANTAYQQAITLAPTYFRPHWILANFLLRNDRITEGVKALVQLADADPDMASQIFDLVWQSSGGDSQIFTHFGQQLRSDQTRAELVTFLTEHDRTDEAIEIWHRVTPSSKLKFESGIKIIPKLLELQEWESTRQIWFAALQARFGPLPETEALFWNAGFEKDPIQQSFDWVLSDSPQVALSMDSVISHTGQRSLQIYFRPNDNVRFSGVHHDLLVRPSTRYQLRFQYKTEGMLPLNGISVEVVDALHPGLLKVQTPPLQNFTDWQSSSLTFETPSVTPLVRVRILRAPAGFLHDYIEGKIWFDDFALEASRS